METIADRRRRKLITLVERHGGLSRLAQATNQSAASLDQVIKRTPLPPKKDGTRSAKALGPTAARAIEDALQLGRGWFDADDVEAASSPAAAPAPNPAPDSLLQALNVLAAAISNADELTRISIEPLLSRLAQRPQESGTIAQRIYEELSVRAIGSQRGETDPPSQLFDLDTKKMEQSGQRNRTAAQGGRKNF